CLSSNPELDCQLRLATHLSSKNGRCDLAVSFHFEADFQLMYADNNDLLYHQLMNA
ncbi:hypothetical protein WA026_015369, partial [Henosepilachna vigintioctopunctata]